MDEYWTNARDGVKSVIWKNPASTYGLTSCSAVLFLCFMCCCFRNKWWWWWRWWYVLLLMMKFASTNHLHDGHTFWPDPTRSMRGPDSCPSLSIATANVPETFTSIHLRLLRLRTKLDWHSVQRIPPPRPLIPQTPGETYPVEGYDLALTYARSAALYRAVRPPP